MSDTDNASLLTNAVTLLERYRAEERAMELELHLMQVRLEMIRDVVGTLSGQFTRRTVRRSRTPRPVEPTGETNDAIDAFADAVA